RWSGDADVRRLGHRAHQYRSPRVSSLRQITGSRECRCARVLCHDGKLGPNLQPWSGSCLYRTPNDDNDPTIPRWRWRRLSRWACALLAFTKVLFVGAEAALRIACECALARSNHFAVAVPLFDPDSVVIPIP